MTDYSPDQAEQLRVLREQTFGKVETVYDLQERFDVAKGVAVTMLECINADFIDNDQKKLLLLDCIDLFISLKKSITGVSNYDASVVENQLNRKAVGR